MKRYLLFGGYSYYAAGGWYDFMGSFDSLGEALRSQQWPEENYQYVDAPWRHVIDSHTGAMVADESRKELEKD